MNYYDRIAFTPLDMGDPFLHFFLVLVLTCRGAAPVKTNAGNNFLEAAREFAPKYVGNASLFTKFSFTILVPLNLPPPNQQCDGFPLEFLLKKHLKQNCEHSAKIVNKPSKNCEQTEL